MAAFQIKHEGLGGAEVRIAREKYGLNTLGGPTHKGTIHIIRDLISEPMFLLLTAVSSVYFLTGNYLEGMVMIGAILLVSCISLFQEARSENALNSLKKLTKPRARVIRESIIREIMTEEIVPGDLIVVEEGNVVPADAIVLHSNDFSVNEAILTGEAYSVIKDKREGKNQIFNGTLVLSGSAVARVNATGAESALGRIGKSLDSISVVKSPMQQQIASFVRKMAVTGAVLFMLVWIVNYLTSGSIVSGLLHGLTLAMSVLPEEIPVAFTTFMALGAWRLMKDGVLTKQLHTVESLGSATVICIDKTGTITNNSMRVARIYDFREDRIADLADCQSENFREIIEFGMWACEPNPFDPMEMAIHDSYVKTSVQDRRPSCRMIHEYPIGGRPPLMTHIFESGDKKRIIAAKGAWEGLIAHSYLSPDNKVDVARHAHRLASEGYRVIGVARATFPGMEFPRRQEDFNWEFLGLIALDDPPKDNIREVFQRFYRAGIEVKIITGDYPETTQAIARQTGLEGADRFLHGEDVEKMTAGELRESVREVNIFARMFPEAKLRVIEALKDNGEIVAMTGDGVNDAPAMKSAHIGVAMGKRGTETARNAASVILLEDDLGHMADAVAQGRRIYANLKKAILYIISIHIPIMLTVALPLLLGWKYANIFSPLHVIFFELIMGPTCSIIFENEPLEQRLMHQKPRKITGNFFSIHELSLSIIQGLVITAGVLTVYFVSIKMGYSESAVRTLVFGTIILSNVLLTLENRSFFHSGIRTLQYRNYLVPLIIILTLLVYIGLITIPGMQILFELTRPDIDMFLLSIVLAAISVTWIELYKWYRRTKYVKTHGPGPLSNRIT